MALKGKPITIGNVATTIFTCPAGVEASVHGLIFSNNGATPLTVSVLIFNQADNTTVTVATGLVVPPNQFITWTKPINLASGDSIQATASASSGIVCLFSVFEGSAAPVAIGFTGRGEWSNVSTFAVNDIVSVTGEGTFLALAESIDQDPTSNTAAWMFLEGISASALPAQAGQEGKFLTTDGTDASFAVVDVAGGANIDLNRTSNLVLTSSDKRVQKISFTDNDFTVSLPSATSLSEGGALFVIENRGDFAITVLTTNGLPVTLILPGGLVQLYLVDNTITDGIWQINVGTSQGPFAVSQTINVDSTKSITQGYMVQFADDKFLAAYYDDTDTTNFYLRVVDFSGASPVLGTRTSFTLSQNTGAINPHPILEKLQDNKVLICYNDRTGENLHLALGRVLDINGTTITVGGANTLATQDQTSRAGAPGGVSAAVLSPTSFVLSFSFRLSPTNQRYSQRIVACTISGSSISAGSPSGDLRAGGYFGATGHGAVAEGSSRITHWNSTTATAIAPEQWRRFSVSGTSLTLERTDNLGRFDLGSRWELGPIPIYRDDEALYVMSQQHNGPGIAIRKWVRDAGNNDVWSRSDALGSKILTIGNSLRSTSQTMSIYSSSGGVTVLAVVNNGVAGLAGSGMLLSFVVDDENTGAFFPRPFSFLVPGEGLQPFKSFTLSMSMNAKNLLPRNNNGDLFIPVKNNIDNTMDITKISLTST